MVAANSARLVWDEGWSVGRCGWSTKSAGWGGDGRRTVRVGVEMVAANSARLVWNEGWPVGRCGWSAKSAGWGGDGGGEQCGLVWDEGWPVSRWGVGVIPDNVSRLLLKKKIHIISYCWLLFVHTRTHAHTHAHTYAHTHAHTHARPRTHTRASGRVVVDGTLVVSPATCHNNEWATLPI